jgi:hypothetical protein
LGTRVEIAAKEEDERDSPSLYGRTAGYLDTRHSKSNGRYPKVQDRQDKSYAAGYTAVEPNARHMPHLIDSDDEIYMEEPVNEDRARERIS